jgi:peptidyl-tRNA hydrolase
MKLLRKHVRAILDCQILPDNSDDHKQIVWFDLIHASLQRGVQKASFQLETVSTVCAIKKPLKRLDILAARVLATSLKRGVNDIFLLTAESHEKIQFFI